MELGTHISLPKALPLIGRRASFRGMKLLLVVFGLIPLVLLPSLFGNELFFVVGGRQPFCRGMSSGFRSQQLGDPCLRTAVRREVRERRAGQEDPKILTSKMCKAKSAAELLAFAAKNVDSRDFNTYHVSAVFSKIAKFKKLNKLDPDDRQRKKVWPRLVSRLRSMLKQNSLNARTLANVVYAVAELYADISMAQDLADLIPGLLAAVEAKSADMTPQGLSNCLWAVAKLKSEVPAVLKLVPILVRRMVQNRMDRLGPQDLSNNFWAVAVLYDAVPEVLKIAPVLALQLPAEVHNMNPQALSNSLWAVANLQDTVPEVLVVVPALAHQVKDEINRLSTVDLSTCFWASAKLHQASPEVLDMMPVLLKSIRHRITGMSTQALANCLWAVAKLKTVEPQVLEAVPLLVSHGSHRLAEYAPEGLRISLWAAAQLGEHDLETKVKAELARRRL